MNSSKNGKEGKGGRGERWLRSVASSTLGRAKGKTYALTMLFV